MDDVDDVAGQREGGKVSEIHSRGWDGGWDKICIRPGCARDEGWFWQVSTILVTTTYRYVLDPSMWAHH